MSNSKFILDLENQHFSLQKLIIVSLKSRFVIINFVTLK